MFGGLQANLPRLHGIALPVTTFIERPREPLEELYSIFRRKRDRKSSGIVHTTKVYIEDYHHHLVIRLALDYGSQCHDHID